MSQPELTVDPKLARGDVYVLVIEDVAGQSLISGAGDKGMIIRTWDIEATLPLQIDVANLDLVAGRVVISDMTIRKMSDVATPGLYSACAEAKVFGKATLTIGRTIAGAINPRMTWIMEQVIVASITTSADARGEPIDLFKLNFTKISLDYQQKENDLVSGGNDGFAWDMAKNILP
jgi:type VI secretion system secreted protein Hcp